MLNILFNMKKNQKKKRISIFFINGIRNKSPKIPQKNFFSIINHTCNVVHTTTKINFKLNKM